MKSIFGVLALALVQSTAFAAPVSAKGSSAMNPRPPEAYQGQWYTTPDRCSYSRAQAPGYPVQWVLILNPFHIGQPNAHKGCPVRL